MRREVVLYPLEHAEVVSALKSLSHQRRLLVEREIPLGSQTIRLKISAVNDRPNLATLPPEYLRPYLKSLGIESVQVEKLLPPLAAVKETPFDQVTDLNLYYFLTQHFQSYSPSVLLTAAAPKVIAALSGFDLEETARLQKNPAALKVKLLPAFFTVKESPNLPLWVVAEGKRLKIGALYDPEKKIFRRMLDF